MLSARQPAGQHPRDGQAIEATSADVFVSWLPLYHDMGLIGAWLGSLYYGAPLTIMSPLASWCSPARWLWSIHRYRGDAVGGPNFAFELCLKPDPDEALEGLDLSRCAWRSTAPSRSRRDARALHERFALRLRARGDGAGLRAGRELASAWPSRRSGAGRIDRVERDALRRDGWPSPRRRRRRRALEFVACGRAAPGHEVRIVDEAGPRAAASAARAAWSSAGPSATSGYFRNEPKTTRAVPTTAGSTAATSPISPTATSIITGRIKDIIIRAGRNIYPHELEEAVGAIEGMRKGCVVAFASGDARTQTERLVVMAETRLTAESDKEALRERIAQPRSRCSRRRRTRSCWCRPMPCPRPRAARSAARRRARSTRAERSPKAVARCGFSWRGSVCRPGSIADGALHDAARISPTPVIGGRC